MADFRKWFFAFAVLGLMLGASTAYAQGIPPGPSSIQCNFTPSNPTVVSVENEAALVGDVVLICTGGTPTPANQTIPLFNVTLSLNTNITSRLFVAPAGGYIDALLVIDDSFPTVPFPANAQQQIGSPTGQRVCYSVTQGGAGSVPVNCNIFNGTFNTGTFLFAGNPYNQPGSSNIFVAHQTGVAQISWEGVPIDAPGTAGARIIRLTNIRANACQTGLGSTLVPQQIVAFLAINGSSNITINGNTQAVVAQVQTGLIVGAKSVQLQQCVSVNALAAANNTATGIVATTNVTVTEGYAAAFRRRVLAGTTVTDVNDGNNVIAPPQNVPGFNYNSETGLQPPQPAGGAAIPFGAASAGDRILLRFNNVSAGIALFLPQSVVLTQVGGAPGNPIPASARDGWAAGFLEMVSPSSDASGNLVAGVTPTGAFALSALFGTGTPAAGQFIAAVPIPVVNGSANVVYEVANADPNATETAKIPIAVAYIANTANNLPSPGQSTINVSYAPLSGVGIADPAAPIPRFCDKSTPLAIWNINLCTCNLLFPFVTNQNGFDTGIAVANTTADPYGTAAQAGTVKLVYFGATTGGGAAPASQTSAIVHAGEELTFTLSSGGDHGITATPGFQGYMFAIAQFQLCHGFMFMSDLGAQKLAMGYLAIQLDTPQWSEAALEFGAATRTGIINEGQGH
ncbi:MAG TPA: hypothetical protein VEV17_04340 [Bryobacteraceae bacterium]|nr:hypothetical protein [Bryobacteraceae bacterium]